MKARTVLILTLAMVAAMSRSGYADDRVSLTFGLGLALAESATANPWTAFLGEVAYHHGDVLVTVRHVRNTRIELHLFNGGLKRPEENSEWALLAGLRRSLSRSSALELAAGPAIVNGTRDQWFPHGTNPPIGRVTYSAYGLALQGRLAYRKLGLACVGNLNAEQSWASLLLTFRLPVYRRD